MNEGSTGRRLDLAQTLHASTKRDYVGRVLEFDKAAAAEVARAFGPDYWDGERRFGYGGYRYDGRHRPIAQKLAQVYNLQAGQRVLDIGCGKGFLLYDLTQVVPGLQVCGLDISAYAIEHAKQEVRPFLRVGSAADPLPFESGSFDLAISFATLHNLGIADLWTALGEMERVAHQKYLMVEAYRNEREKMNLLYWQLTCLSFFSVQDWEWIFNRTGYRGDYGFIFFE